MTESFLKVVMTEERNDVYGKREVRKVVEEHISMEKYDMEGVPPFGIEACVTIGESKKKFYIVANRYYLACDHQDEYIMVSYAYFIIDNSLYELEVRFSRETDTIEVARLSEWVMMEYYNYGLNADKVYEVTDFEPYTEE
jgi:hypothetical protein